MNVSIALEMDSALESQAAVITDAAIKMKSFFADRNYGTDLSNIIIGIILTGPGSERLHPVRKATYHKTLKFINRIINLPMEITNIFQYDLKPDYEIFSRLHGAEARQWFVNALIDSTMLIEKHKSKFPDFDVQRFMADLRLCLA
jgi:hypothetical protein